MTATITTGPATTQDAWGIFPPAAPGGGRGQADQGARAVGAALTRHLLTDPRCRRLWQSRANRSFSGRINQAAVAQILAEWMWDSGEAPDTDCALPRKLKDRVSRALAGHYIAPQTLRAFIEAFDLPAEVADALWDSLYTPA